MRKRWTKWMGIVLAGSILMGCGSRPGSTLEPLTADEITGMGAVQEQAGSGGEEAESQRGQARTAGEEAESQRGQSGSGGEEAESQRGQAGFAGEEAESQRGQSGSGGEETEPGQAQRADGGVWDRENDSDYTVLQQFSRQLALENMEGENPLLSPVSAYLALGMVGMGAQGETAQEFRDMLGDNMPAISQKLMERYPQKQEGMVLTVANSAWVDRQLTPDQQWITDLDEIFRGEEYQGELSSQEIAERINSWCSENTEGLIPTMLDRPLADDTRLAVLDAIYFKGDWSYPFDPLYTAQRPFTKEDGTQLQVDTMCMWGENQRYLHSDLGKGVLLPYVGEDFAYVALLPNEGTSAREFYRGLTQETLTELLESESRELCNLCLPKYEVSFARELNESLQAMGLVKAFDSEQADLSGLGETWQGTPLYISLVKQKAVFRVDEKGTEAAAVTMVAVQDNAAFVQEEPKELYFDRPFVYMILDQKTQVPLFVGIMDDPS